MIGLIVGNGRSGTHMLARILKASPDTIVTIEENPMWTHAVTAASLPATRPKRIPLLVKEYKAREHPTKLYIDKSHPNLWLKEELDKGLPAVKFISIYRNPFAVVSSMLEHVGAAAWCVNWKKYGPENPFTGITRQTQVHYITQGLEARCALKWLSHYREAQRIKKYHNVITVRYEDLVTCPGQQVKRICDALRIRVGDFPRMKRRSLTKWKKNLSKQQQTQIRDTLEKFDPGNEYL